MIPSCRRFLSHSFPSRNHNLNTFTTTKNSVLFTNTGYTQLKLRSPTQSYIQQKQYSLSSLNKNHEWNHQLNFSNHNNIGKQNTRHKLIKDPAHSSSPLLSSSLWFHQKRHQHYTIGYLDKKKESSQPILDSFQLIEFNEKGEKKNVEKRRAEMYREFGLVGRELRALTSSLRTTMIYTRKDSIIFCALDTRAIICSNRVYLLHARDPNTQHVSTLIESQLRSNREFEAEQRAVVAAGGEEAWYDRDPYEFQVLDILLKHITDMIDSEYEYLDLKVKNLLHDTTVHVDKSVIRTLLQLKYRLDGHAARVQDVYNALSEILEDDEEMADMYLTVKKQVGMRRRVDEHDEIELLIEGFSHQCEDLLNRVATLRSSISAAQDSINIELDSVRNNILHIELRIAVATLAVTIGGLVTGAFGMNLLSAYEEHPLAFYYVCGMVVVISIVMYFSLWRAARPLITPKHTPPTKSTKLKLQGNKKIDQML
eukprot:gb/GECH01003952.1/.p1 GENE.gb/GECH01003952.1/~~gb/GECH01003952.1/.p1  ORF type:complete len:482 (+),score=82.34 gb/GECH01003952.1/:1-1446(+)